MAYSANTAAWMLSLITNWYAHDPMSPTRDGAVPSPVEIGTPAAHAT